VYRLEDALRSIEGCEDVTLPYWDETLFRPEHPETGKYEVPPIPTILTTHELEVPIDGSTHNPLFSYTLQRAIEAAPGREERYTKPQGYKTVRYPLSGLVGTQKDRDHTAAHNARFSDPNGNVRILNDNVAQWLKGTVELPRDGNEKTTYPDTSSVYARFMLSLDAPTYTTFSNKASATAWVEVQASSEHVFNSLETPHNAMHLAVGGFYQEGKYIASPIIGANGDMGDNETAGFDPIFFFHHCFIDYVFWAWQRKWGCTDPGSLTIDYTEPPRPGTFTDEGMPSIPKGTLLTMETNLYPFRKTTPDPEQPYQTGNDLVNIEQQLGYSYAPGSLDVMQLDLTDKFLTHNDRKELVRFQKAKRINRADYPGSFIIRLLANGPDGKPFQVGYEPVLSRWSVANCANCQSHLEVEAIFPIYQSVENTLLQNEEKIGYWVEIQTREGFGLRNPETGGKSPLVDEIPLKD